MATSAVESPAASRRDRRYSAAVRPESPGPPRPWSVPTAFYRTTHKVRSALSPAELRRSRKSTGTTVLAGRTRSLVRERRRSDRTERARAEVRCRPPNTSPRITLPRAASLPTHDALRTGVRLACCGNPSGLQSADVSSAADGAGTRRAVREQPARRSAASASD